MFKVDYRSSKVDTSITDLQRSTHRSSVFEGQHIHLQRSTYRSSKVDTSISEGRHIVTSIFEGRHIDLRKSTPRSSKVDASIFEGGNITPTNIVHVCAPKSLDTLGSYVRTCRLINSASITPRWEKGGTRPKCCISNCHATSFATSKIATI